MVNIWSVLVMMAMCLSLMDGLRRNSNPWLIQVKLFCLIHCADTKSVLEILSFIFSFAGMFQRSSNSLMDCHDIILKTLF